MEITRFQDGTFQLMSDGSIKENEVLNIIVELMTCSGNLVSDDLVTENDHGTCSEDGGKTYKNYLYLPSMDMLTHIIEPDPRTGKPPF